MKIENINSTPKTTRPELSWEPVNKKNPMNKTIQHQADKANNKLNINA